MLHVTHRLFFPFSETLLLVVMLFFSLAGCMKGHEAAATPPSFVSQWTPQGAIEKTRSTALHEFEAWEISSDLSIKLFYGVSEIQEYTVGFLDRTSSKEAKLVLSDMFIQSLKKDPVLARSFGDLTENAATLTLSNNSQLAITRLIRGRETTAIFKSVSKAEIATRSQDYLQLMVVQRLAHKNFLQTQLNARFELLSHVDEIRSPGGQILETVETFARDVPESFEGQNPAGGFFEKINAKSFQFLNDQEVLVNDRKVTYYRLAVEKSGAEYRTILALVDPLGSSLANEGQTEGQNEHIIFSGLVSWPEQAGSSTVMTVESVSPIDLSAGQVLRRKHQFVRQKIR
jgi:hypothetical protein